MITREVTDEEVVTLSTREESHFFDKKALAVSGKAVQKIAVAFANADGGEFLIGIVDDTDAPDPEDRWQGAENIEAFNSHLQALFDVQPTLDVRSEFLKHKDDKGYVLRVEVEKSSGVHKTTDNTVYQRHGAQSLPIKDPQQIAQLSFAKGSTTYEDQLLKDVPPEQIVESHELASFLSEYSPKTDPLDFVINQNLLESQEWITRVASALLFHPEPSAVVPRKCALKITRYETKEDDPERDHLADQETIEGPSYVLIRDTVDAVMKMMSAVKVWTADGLKSLEYPPEAIWEIIVNAILHRDYSISDDIQIFIFDNRIEILSPGRLPGYVTVDNILDARYSRNPKIVRTLNRYHNAPNKDLGEGLNTAFQKMKEWGLKEPEIFEDKNYVKVVLPHVPLAAPTEAIMKFLRSHDRITNKQARELTGIKSENLVKAEFYKLRDAKFLERVDGLHGPKSAWQLTDAGRAEHEK